MRLPKIEISNRTEKKKKCRNAPQSPKMVKHLPRKVSKYSYGINYNSEGRTTEEAHESINVLIKAENDENILEVDEPNLELMQIKEETVAKTLTSMITAKSELSA